MWDRPLARLDKAEREIRYAPRKPVGTSGYATVGAHLRWRTDAPLAEIAAAWRGVGERYARQANEEPATARSDESKVVPLLRVKLTMSRANAQTMYQTVSLGSSFGANPFELHKGLGATERAAVVEVYRPTTGITQMFRDVKAGQHCEATESSAELRARDLRPIPLRK